MAEQFKSCEQPDCPVAKDGKCLEGLDLEKCTHFYWADQPEEPVDPTAAAKPESVVPDNSEQLYFGEELTTEQLKTITYQYDFNLVMIVGESESGKTTILGSIFDLFQMGLVKKFSFAGSKTLIGFERRCHPSRRSSNAKKPVTDKTPSKEFGFLHLAVKPKDALTKKAHHLLLSDISGERFRLARDSSPAMLDLDLMKFADHIIFVIDGSKLADKFKRTAAISHAQMFIQRALDTNLYDKGRVLTVAITKSDLLIPETFDYDKLIKTPFKHKFESRLKELTFIELAIRPDVPTDELQFGNGTDELLTEWIQKIEKPAVVNSEFIEPARAFGNFKFNYE